MPVQTTCSGCKSRMRLPDEYANRTVKCPKCGQVFKAAPDTAPSPVAAAPAKTAPSTALPPGGQTGKTTPVKSPPAASKPGPSTPIPPGKAPGKPAASPLAKEPAAKAPPKKKIEEEINVDEAVEEEVDVDEAVEEEEVNVDEAVEEEEVDVDEAVEEETENAEDGSPFRSPLLKDDPFEDHEDLPDWFIDLIKRELSKKERIVWVGRSSMRLLKAQSWIALPVGIVLIVGAIVALIFSGTVTEFGLFLGLLLGGIFILLIGSAFTAAPWLVSLSGKYGPVYVLTTRRALIWEAVTRIRTEETFKAYLVPQLVKMERRESGLVKGAGDLVFGYRLVAQHGSSRGSALPEKKPVGFLKLDGVRAVEKMIRETLLDSRTDAFLS